MKKNKITKYERELATVRWGETDIRGIVINGDFYKIDSDKSLYTLWNLYECKIELEKLSAEDIQGIKQTEEPSEIEKMILKSVEQDKNDVDITLPIKYNSTS